MLYILQIRRSSWLLLCERWAARWKSLPGLQGPIYMPTGFLLSVKTQQSTCFRGFTVNAWCQYVKPPTCIILSVCYCAVCCLVNFSFSGTYLISFQVSASLSSGHGEESKHTHFLVTGSSCVHVFTKLIHIFSLQPSFLENRTSGLITNRVAASIFLTCMQSFDWRLSWVDMSSYALPRSCNSQWVIMWTSDSLSLLPEPLTSQS